MFVSPPEVITVFWIEPLAGTGTAWPLTVTWVEVVPFVELVTVDVCVLVVLASPEGVSEDEESGVAVVWVACKLRAAELGLDAEGLDAAVERRAAATRMSTMISTKTPASSILERLWATKKLLPVVLIGKVPLALLPESNLPGCLSTLCRFVSFTLVPPHISSPLIVLHHPHLNDNR